MNNVLVKFFCIFFPLLMIAGCFILVFGGDLENYNVSTFSSLIENSPRIHYDFQFSTWLSDSLNSWADKIVAGDLTKKFIGLNVNFVSRMALLTDFLFNAVIDFINALSFLFYFINFFMNPRVS